MGRIRWGQLTGPVGWSRLWAVPSVDATQLIPGCTSGDGIERGSVGVVEVWRYFSVARRSLLPLPRPPVARDGQAPEPQRDNHSAYAR